MRRLLALALVIPVVATLAGCLPATTGGRVHHTLHMIVQVRIDGKPVGTPVRVSADVKIRTGEHGINRDSGRPYPTTWRGSTPQDSLVDYWTDSNPTTFTIVGEMTSAAARTRTVNYSRGKRVQLLCYMLRDGHAIPQAEILGQQEQVITAKIDRIDPDRIWRTSCTWTDRS